MTLREKLKSGEKVFGTMLRMSRSPAVCYLAKHGGFDFVMFDCEQSSYTINDMHDLFVMGNALNLAGLLRAPALEKEHISRPLDCGAGGVMVPMIETAEQAAVLAGFSKYPPLGERGYAAGGAGTDFKGGKAPEIMSAANMRILSIAQIETGKAVDNAEHIAAVEGIDMLLIGPNDLSVSLGIPGDLMNPMELEAIGHVAEACRASGKFFGLHGGLALLEKFRDKLDFIMSQSDTDMLAGAMKDTAENCKKLFA
jgi:2-keto-3-deoxy-L-rhamnonate aldolase RhmA